MHVTTASKGPLEKKKLWSYGTAGWGGCEICTGDTNRGLCGLSAELRRIRLCHEVRNYRVKMSEGADMQSAQERAAFSSDGNILLSLKPLKISCVWTFLPRLPLHGRAVRVIPGLERYHTALWVTALWCVTALQPQKASVLEIQLGRAHVSKISTAQYTLTCCFLHDLYVWTSNVTPCYRDRSSSHGIH